MGSAVHIIVATIGLQFLIGAASSVLPWLQIAGGAYILYLAQQSFSASEISDEADRKPSMGVFEAVFSGFVACVSNPKAIIFFAALFPGFIDPNLNVLFQSAVYGIVFITLDVISILGYAALAIFVFNTRAFKGLNYNTFSGIGFGVIGTLLVLKGLIEVLTD